MSRRGAFEALSSQVLISTATPAQNYVNLFPQFSTEEAKTVQNTKCKPNNFVIVILDYVRRPE
jgi:hypothetical protein